MRTSHFLPAILSLVTPVAIMLVCLEGSTGQEVYPTGEFIRTFMPESDLCAGIAAPGGENAWLAMPALGGITQANLTSNFTRLILEQGFHLYTDLTVAIPGHPVASASREVVLLSDLQPEINMSRIRVFDGFIEEVLYDTWWTSHMITTMNMRPVAPVDYIWLGTDDGKLLRSTWALAEVVDVSPANITFNWIRCVRVSDDGSMIWWVEDNYPSVIWQADTSVLPLEPIVFFNDTTPGRVIQDITVFASGPFNRICYNHGGSGPIECKGVGGLSDSVVPTNPAHTNIWGRMYGAPGQMLYQTLLPRRLVVSVPALNEVDVLSKTSIDVQYPYGYSRDPERDIIFHVYQRGPSLSAENAIVGYERGFRDVRDKATVYLQYQWAIDCAFEPVTRELYVAIDDPVTAGPRPLIIRIDVGEVVFPEPGSDEQGDMKLPYTAVYTKSGGGAVQIEWTPGPPTSLVYREPSIGEINRIILRPGPNVDYGEPENVFSWDTSVHGGGINDGAFAIDHTTSTLYVVLSQVVQVADLTTGLSKGVLQIPFTDTPATLYAEPINQRLWWNYVNPDNMDVYSAPYNSTGYYTRYDAQERSFMGYPSTYNAPAQTFYLDQASSNLITTVGFGVFGTWELDAVPESKAVPFDCPPGYYGANCTACTDCGNGRCDDLLAGSGVCSCLENFEGATCNECIEGKYSPQCTDCPLDCGDHGICVDGFNGDGSCVCDPGYTGPTCVGETQQVQPVDFGSLAAIGAIIGLGAVGGLVLYTSHSRKGNNKSDKTTGSLTSGVIRKKDGTQSSGRSASRNSRSNSRSNKNSRSNSSTGRSVLSDNTSLGGETLASDPVLGKRNKPSFSDNASTTAVRIDRGQFPHHSDDDNTNSETSGTNSATISSSTPPKPKRASLSRKRNSTGRKGSLGRKGSAGRKGGRGTKKVIVRRKSGAKKGQRNTAKDVNTVPISAFRGDEDGKSVALSIGSEQAPDIGDTVSRDFGALG